VRQIPRSIERISSFKFVILQRLRPAL